jgi:hypothetical protein
MRRKSFAVALVAALVPAGVRANAPAGRYNVVSGAMVIDNKTLLTWQKTPSSSTYTWGGAANAGTAQNYCATLSLDGLGWRLPTLKELLTLVDYSQPSGNMIDPAFASGPTPNFWSSTPMSGSPSNAWFVVFGYGNTNFSGTSSAYGVRCVR